MNPFEDQERFARTAPRPTFQIKRPILWAIAASGIFWVAVIGLVVHFWK